MLDNFLFVATQKLAILFVAGLGIVGGFLAMGPASQVPAAQTAIIVHVNPYLASSSTILTSSTPQFATAFPNIPFGLLPTIVIPFCPASSTCGKKGLQTLAHLFGAINKLPVPKTSAPTSASAAAAVTPKSPQPITAQAFLSDTTSSFKSLLNGSDELVFTTNLGNLGGPTTVTWGMLTTTIGGGGSIPEFSVTSSCTPVPNQPAVDAVDQTPTFTVQTAYDCTVSLTPQSGADRRTQTKNFSFTTPPGELLVTPDASMDTVLVNNTNNGGIIFNNQDSNSVLITQITFNAYYSYLNTSGNIPLILRFQDPATGDSLVDYPLTNPSSTNVTLPLSLVIPAFSQKFLPIQVLGVQKMLVLNSTPNVTIQITGVTTNRSDVKDVFHNPTVSWSCIVSQESYNPNATDSPYATGQACLH